MLKNSSKCQKTTSYHVIFTDVSTELNTGNIGKQEQVFFRIPNIFFFFRRCTNNTSINTAGMIAINISTRIIMNKRNKLGLVVSDVSRRKKIIKRENFVFIHLLYPIFVSLAKAMLLRKLIAYSTYYGLLCCRTLSFFVVQVRVWCDRLIFR